eukprot:NODE_19384_length_845_cov_4.579387.p1 GENE.NODE_19384_length_845_cov_4.579387~~NODE_19384_length_845_cov_4.579387.p1  ORF type:complete len:140 (+),score=24.83 NODE_19384_length_845_cov_4.579387:203-622(+)
MPLPMTAVKLFAVFAETYYFIDWLTDLFKVVLGGDAAGDLTWAVHLTFLFATLVLWIRFFSFYSIFIVDEGCYNISVACSCCLTSVVVPQKLLHEPQKPTVVLMGLPLFSALVMFFADPTYIKKFERTSQTSSATSSSS